MRHLTMFICLLAMASFCQAAVIHVPTDQPTIQAGIDAAVNGDTVSIAPGTYQEIIDFMGKAIVVKGEKGADSTIFTYPSMCDELVLFTSGEDTLSILEGITIRDVSYSNMPLISVLSSSATIRNCAFIDNTSPSAGNMIEYMNGYVILESNVFVGNRPRCVACNAVKGRIRNNLFMSNGGPYSGALGVGGVNGRSSVVIEGNLFIDNESPDGGGLFISENDNSIVRNNTFVGNYSHQNIGGAICVWFYCYGINISGNIIVGSTGYGITNHYGSTVSFDCNDAWNNSPSDYAGDIDPGAHSFSKDPLFCDTLIGNYRLFYTSPCLPESTICGQVGAYGLGCGPGQVNGFEILCETLTNLIGHVPVFSWAYYCPISSPEDSFEIAVGTNPDWVHAEMWNPEAFAGPDTFVTYAGLPLMDGNTYYLRLRVHNGLAWSEWYNTSFRMNSVPTVPVNKHPDVLEPATTTTPTLWVLNSSDAESDALLYDFEVLDFSENVVASASGIPQQADTTGWTVDVPLVENGFYYWQARVFDGYEYSAWSFGTLFMINETEEYPSSFLVYYPPDTDNGQVYDKPVEFIWGTSTDPDPIDTVTYKLLIAIDSNFTFVATHCCMYSPIFSVGDLNYSTHYWWKVQAIDMEGHTTTSTNTADFWTWILGDANGDRKVTAGDAVFLVSYIFRGGPPPIRLKAGDANGDCRITVGDAVYLISYIFREGPAPKVGCAK